MRLAGCIGLIKNMIGSRQVVIFITLEVVDWDLKKRGKRPCSSPAYGGGLYQKPSFASYIQKMAKMSRKQMIKELTPTKEQLKKFHKQLKEHGLSVELLKQSKLDAEAEN